MVQLKRIQKETRNLYVDPPPGIKVTVDPENSRYFHIIMTGPTGTLYEEGQYRLEMFIPEDYPMVPPNDQLGRICLDILKKNWSPALQIQSVLLSIQALLASPEPDDPLDVVAAEHYKKNREGFEETAREWNRLYAMQPSVNTDTEIPPPT